jgi:hypothetical protein
MGISNAREKSPIEDEDDHEDDYDSANVQIHIRLFGICLDRHMHYCVYAARARNEHEN